MGNSQSTKTPLRNLDEYASTPAIIPLYGPKHFPDPFVINRSISNEQKIENSLKSLNKKSLFLFSLWDEPLLQNILNIETFLHPRFSYDIFDILNPAKSYPRRIDYPNPDILFKTSFPIPKEIKITEQNNQQQFPHSHFSFENCFPPEDLILFENVFQNDPTQLKKNKTNRLFIFQRSFAILPR